jgi:aspartyl-tRNA(Asn)/glutamyl-tRNA(Gln) amidotransferase subunit A
MTLDLKNLTIESAHAMLVNKEITVRDLVFAYLDNAEKQNADIFAFIEFFDKGENFADSIARAQEMIDSGNSHVLTGIPYGIKDNILNQGHIASAGSHMLENYTASYNATVIDKLNAVGAICIGRTNMDDAAMGSSTESSYYGPTKNPLDTSRVPGGSSGGFAAAVAADMCLFALGTDTGGSVRQPAAFCGVVGMYPTYGSVSRYGAIAMGSSLDQIGPFGKNINDAKVVYETITGYDEMDATSITESKRKELKTSSIKKVIGVPRKFVDMEGISEEVKKNFEESLEKLKSQGYEIRDIELPNAHLGLAVYYIIMPAEVSSNLARYDGIKYGYSDRSGNLLDNYLKTRHVGFGVEPRRRILLGTYVLSAGYYDAFYNKATKVREVIKQDFKKIFDSGVDAILTPTAPTTAFKFGEKADPLSMYLADIFTINANLTHMPAISIPSGTDSNGLPFGIQLIANQCREDILFSIGSDFEQSK